MPCVWLDMRHRGDDEQLTGHSSRLATQGKLTRATLIARVTWLVSGVSDFRTRRSAHLGA